MDIEIYNHMDIYIYIYINGQSRGPSRVKFYQGEIPCSSDSSPTMQSFFSVEKTCASN